MKKENKNQRSRQPRTPDNTEQKRDSQYSLNEYGLEPPKIYKREQNRISHQDKERRLKRKQPKPIQQERKIQNKKRRIKNSIIRFIKYAALVVGIIGVIVILSLTVLFKIQTVEISGNKIYTKQQISAVLPIEKEKNLFLADTSSAKEKLEENLPYIYNAQIKRKLPSTIIVNIEETPQVYALKTQDKTYTLFDDEFKVLETAVQKKPKKTILIKKAAIKEAIPGREAQFTNEKIKNNLKTLIDEQKRLKLDKITELYSVDINNNYMVYDSRITIKLGTCEGLENKIYSALAAIEKLEAQNPQAQGVLNVSTGKQIYFTEGQ